jgi:hypothetical protein
MSGLSLRMLAFTTVLATFAACTDDTPVAPTPAGPSLDELCGPGTYGSGHVCSQSTTTTAAGDSVARGPGTYGSGH